MLSFYRYTKLLYCVSQHVLLLWISFAQTCVVKAYLQICKVVNWCWENVWSLS